MKNLKTVITNNVIDIATIFAALFIIALAFTVGVSAVGLIAFAALVYLVVLSAKYLIRNWLIVVLIVAGFGILSLSSCSEKNDIRPCDNTTITLRNVGNVMIKIYDVNGALIDSKHLTEQGHSIKVKNSVTHSIEFINIGGYPTKLITNDCGIFGDDILID